MYTYLPTTSIFTHIYLVLFLDLQFTTIPLPQKSFEPWTYIVGTTSYKVQAYKKFLPSPPIYFLKTYV